MRAAAVNGGLEDLPYGDNYEFGPSGRKALCVKAMLVAGESADDEILSAVLDQLLQENSQSVRFRALRVLAMTELGLRASEKFLDVINLDVAWLVERCGSDGAYGVYANGSLTQEQAADSDNFSSFLAHWSVLSAARYFENFFTESVDNNSLYNIPKSYWRAMERYWQGTQLADGGWSHDRGGKRSYGSASAAALAMLIAAEDRLDNGRPQSGKAKNRYTEGAIDWLAGNFSSWQNPSLGPQYYYRWALAMDLVSTEGGYVTLGDNDFRHQLACRLLNTQHIDGSWGDCADTAMAMIYLSQMRRPILFGKLKYPGLWSSRPFDVAQLSRWFSSSFERDVRWRVVDVDSDLQYWRDTPVLVISGASRPVFSEHQLQRLRDYVYRGGLIVSVAVGDSAAFNVEMAKVYKKLFSGHELKNIEQSHPIFNTYRKLDRQLRLQGISNGVRLLAIHCSQDISRFWQEEKAKDDMSGLLLAANIYLHATDFGAFNGSVDAIDVRSTPLVPSTRQTEIAGEVSIAVVNPSGEKFCEPFALERFKNMLLADGWAATITDGVLPQELPDLQCNLAIVSGLKSFELDKRARESLLNFIDSGGLLLCTAAGAEGEFDLSIESEIHKGLLGNYSVSTALLDDQSGPLALKNLEISKVRYRRAAAIMYGGDNTPRLIGKWLGSHLLSIYSRDDILVSLVGFRGQAIRGYSSDDAYRLLRNIAIYAATRTKSETPVLPNSVHVQWSP